MIKQLFLLATLLMNRLRYPYKLTLIGLLFLLPLSIVMYYFEREINGGIEFARQERSGVAYEITLTALLQNVLRDQPAVDPARSKAQRPRKAA